MRFDERLTVKTEKFPVEDELLDKLIFRCHANPYWLYDDDCDADYAYENFEENAVLMGDYPCVYAKPDVILRWIKDGKPRKTSWEDGITE